MDLTFDVLIQRSDINKLNISEILVEWGGEQFSQEPKKYCFNSSLFFRENNDTRYYESILSDDFNLDDFLMLILEGDSLKKLEYDLNSAKKSQYNNELILFVRELYDSLDVFCISKLIDDEKIGDKCRTNNVEEAIEVFLNSLKWESLQGIVIIKKTY